jgi:hypothetical protein
MGSRLFSLSGLVVCPAFALSFACGSNFSAGASNGSTGGTGGSSGDTVVSGAEGGASPGGAGGSPNGGATGGTNAAGTGGKAPTTCDCAAGSYCQDGTNKCRPCTDFSRLEFAPAQKLATVSQTPSGNERFPRAASSGSDLFYRAGAAGEERLWYAAAPVSGIGIPITEMGRIESAPLSAPGALPQNFFFDRLDSNTQLRHIMLATWSGGLLTAAVAAPDPLNGAASDFSIAIAADPARAYWMSTRSGTAELVWAGMLGSGAATVPAPLDLQVQAGSAKCARLADDATPWVNREGTLLLFRNESIDETCASNDSGAFDLYAVPLSKDTGLAATAAIALSSLNTIGGGSNESDPSLSTDSCTIYFASDNGTASSDLYRAQRN